MAMNSLQGVIDCLARGEGEIHVDEPMRARAQRCIERMLDFVQRHPGAVTQPRSGFVPAFGSA
jgi:quinolinate synthase